MARKVRFRAAGGTYTMPEDAYLQEVSNGKRYELLGYADEAPVASDPAAGTVTYRNPINDLPDQTKPVFTKAPSGAVRFVGPQGDERFASASNPYDLKSMEDAGYKRKYGRLEALARSALGGSAYGFGEEIAASQGGYGVPTLSPYVIGREPPGWKDKPRKNSAQVRGELEIARKEASEEYPGAAAAGTVAGGVLGSPMPGGKLAKAGSGPVRSFMRLFGRGEASAALSGAGGTEGGVADRLKGAASSAAAAAPLAASAALVGAPWARKPNTANVDPIQDHSSWLRPWTKGNPEILRNEAGQARVGSFRASPGMLEDVAEKVSKGMPSGQDPYTALTHYGRAVNALPASDQTGRSFVARLAGTQQPMLTNEKGPALLRTFMRESDAAGSQIGNMEATASARGAAVDPAAFMGQVQSGPAARLLANRTDAPARARQASKVMENAQAAVVPFPGMTAVQAGPVSPTDMSKAVQMLRQKAQEEGAMVMGAPASRYGQSVGKAYDEAAAIGNNMKRDASLAVMSPEEQAAYLAARNRFRLTETGANSVNAMKAMAGAPYGVGSEIMGGAGASVLASIAPAEHKTWAAVLGARLGRLLGRQSWVYPDRADSYTRVAEALEGNPTTLGGVVKAAPILAAQRAPDVLERTIGAEVGSDTTPEWIKAHKARIAKMAAEKFTTNQQAP